MDEVSVFVDSVSATHLKTTAFMVKTVSVMTVSVRTLRERSVEVTVTVHVDGASVRMAGLGSCVNFPGLAK